MTNNNAKFAFFYLLSLVALIILALSTGGIIFQIINKSILDALNEYSGSYNPDALKFAVSAVVISAPVFFYMMRQIYKNIFSGALAKDSAIRRWLTYLVLFVTSVVVIGWLIGILNHFFDGELTLKFILKALTAIVISTIIFSFYLYDIRREKVTGEKDLVIRLYFIASLAAVLIVFVASLFFVESPIQTRNRKIDSRIISNMYQIESEVQMYFNENKKLPENLDEVLAISDYLREENILNPVTKEKIEYKKIDEEKYQLCATFMTSGKDSGQYYDPYMSYRSDEKLHGIGYQCLDQKVKKVSKEDEMPVRLVD